MDINFIHILSPILVSIAFLMLGRNMVSKKSGNFVRPLGAMALLVIAILARFFFCEGDLLDKLASILMDFGIGMMINALYLAYHKHQPKIFGVPGVLALILALVTYSFSSFLDWIVHDMRNKPSNVELLVELGPDDHIDEIKPILKKYDAACYIEKAFKRVDMTEDEDLAQFYLIYVDSAFLSPLMRELKNDRENIDFVERSQSLSIIKPIDSKGVAEAFKAPLVANDPYATRQWFVEKLQYNQVYGILKNAKPKRKAKVAIVDTGVDSQHEDLKSIFFKGKAKSDKHGHGTHCAGLAGAATNNGKGIASFNWEGKYIKLMGYAGLDSRGSGTSYKVAKAITDAAEDGADVISLSLGSFRPTPTRVESKAVEYALSKGAIVIAAAGNSDNDAKLHSPANIKGVIVVSAVDSRLNKASFSNTNTSLEMPIAAPGVSILSTFPEGKYKQLDGTSMATPIVSGLVGIMKAFNPKLTPEQAYEILDRTGTVSKDVSRVGRVIHPVKALEEVVK